MNILVLGINGFIGSALSEQLLATTEHFITGIDLDDSRIKPFLNQTRFSFTRGDITRNKQWVEQQIKVCDVVLPLVAIATPSTYVQDPLKVFELDFEANLEIIRWCVKHQKRVIFPSTSEVYGMCPDDKFDEYESNLVTGPINKQRWIYSSSKQLLDRVIYAYGQHENLAFTLFRPFNWIGPLQDNILETKPGGSRVVTQFIGNILRGEPIRLVNGGEQRRCFTDIDDGIECLIKIIENKDNVANQEIFNIGNPNNNFSIKELAELLVKLVKEHPSYHEQAEQTQIIGTDPEAYYGKGYQDIDNRIPNIENAFKKLDWQPHTDLETALRSILDHHLN